MKKHSCSLTSSILEKCQQAQKQWSEGRRGRWWWCYQRCSSNASLTAIWCIYPQQFRSSIKNNSHSSKKQRHWSTLLWRYFFLSKRRFESLGRCCRFGDAVFWKSLRWRKCSYVANGNSNECWFLGITLIHVRKVQV